MISLRNVCANTLVAGVLAWSGIASSAIMVPSFSMTIDTDTMTPMMFDSAMSNVMPTSDPNVFTAMGTHTSTDVWQYDWNLMVDPDPVIGGTFSITNMSSMTQTFSLLFNLPVSPTFTDGYKSGSIGTTLTDSDGNGNAELSNMTWDGLIDGANAMNLLSGGTLCFGGGCSATIFPVSDGPLFHSGDVNTSIGIAMSFDLTAGDTADFTTSFEVNPVPVPAAIWLFGSGLLGLIGMARRKKS